MEMACWIITKIVTIVSRRVVCLIPVFGVIAHVNSSLGNNAIDITGMLKASIKKCGGGKKCKWCSRSDCSSQSGCTWDTDLYQCSDGSGNDIDAPVEEYYVNDCCDDRW